MTLLVRRYRQRPELGWGAFAVLEQPHTCVLAHSVTCDDACLVALHNLSADPVTVPLALAGTEPGIQLVDLLCDGAHDVAAGGSVTVPLPAYGFRWLRVVRPGERRLT